MSILIAPTFGFFVHDLQPCTNDSWSRSVSKQTSSLEQFYPHIATYVKFHVRFSMFILYDRVCTDRVSHTVLLFDANRLHRGGKPVSSQ